MKHNMAYTHARFVFARGQFPLKIYNAEPRLVPCP